MEFHLSMVDWKGVKVNVIMTKICSVVVFYRSMVDWGVNLICMNTSSEHMSSTMGHQMSLMGGT